MTKSTILKTGVLFCKFTRVAVILFLLAFSVVFVHIQINPSIYENAVISTQAHANGVFYSYTNTVNNTSKDLNASEGAKKLQINQLTTNSLYFNYIKIMLALLLGLLSIKEFQNVIESVKEIKTFQKRNITSFRKIGKYSILMVITICYSFFSYQSGATTHGFNFSFELIFLALIAYIMAEVFKEGNSLSEENELTV